MKTRTSGGVPGVRYLLSLPLSAEVLAMLQLAEPAEAVEPQADRGQAEAGQHEAAFENAARQHVHERQKADHDRAREVVQIETVQLGAFCLVELEAGEKRCAHELDSSQQLELRGGEAARGNQRPNHQRGEDGGLGGRFDDILLEHWCCTP